MLNEKQLEIINGSLLGDGCIWKNYVDPLNKFTLTQSKLDHFGINKNTYMLYFLSEFMNLGCSIKLINRKGNGITTDVNRIYEYYVFCTRCNKLWNDIESKWYVPRTDHPRFKRRKIIPQDIKITPLTLCIWHMEDGSNNPTDANIELNTHCFAPEEIDFLIEKLNKDLNIVSKRKIGNKQKTQFKIYIGRKYYFDFIEIIKPFVQWDCFQYKLDILTYNKLPNKGETHALAQMTEQDVRKVFDLHKQGVSQKEIATIVKMSKPNISMILNGIRWKHIDNVDRISNKKPRLSLEEKNEIIKFREQGLFQKQIADQLNINQATVSRVLKNSEYACQE